jgi:hypothetical protein
MILTQRIGDTKTHSVKLAWGGYPFVSSGLFNLIWTLKSAPDNQTDGQASIQKVSGAGLSVTGSTARIELVPHDTAAWTDTAPTPDVVHAEKAPGTYYWDIQAQSINNATDVRTVAKGTLVLRRDVTRLTGASISIYTTAPPDLFPFLEIDGGTPSSDYAAVGELDEGAP